MANHKRKGPKSTRAGCLMCKPHKRQGAVDPPTQERRATTVGEGIEDWLEERRWAQADADMAELAECRHDEVSEDPATGKCRCLYCGILAMDEYQADAGSLEARLRHFGTPYTVDEPADGAYRIVRWAGDVPPPIPDWREEETPDDT